MNDPRDDRDGVELHGSFNVKQFAEMLGLDPSDTTRLANFIRKHKSGQRPSYQEVGAAAKAFIGLVDAPQDITNRAAVMLRRVDAEKYHQKQESVQQEVAEGIRMAKEGIEECWNDMEGQAMTQDNAGEQMSVTISMPGKNISVTTDSADEIGSILRLAGINVGGAASGDVDGDGDHDIADHNAEASASEPAVLYVGAGNSQPEMPSAAAMGDVDGDGDHDMADHKAESADEPKEAAKPDFRDVDNDGNEKESWEDAEEDKDEAKNESARILSLAGVTNEAQSAAQKAAFAKTIAKKNGEPVGEVGIDRESSPGVGQYYMKHYASGKDLAGYDSYEEALAELKYLVKQGVAEGETYTDELGRIMKLSGFAESKLMNSPAGTSMDEPMEFDNLPSEKGTGAGKSDYGTRQSNMGGENPMALHSLDMEESFQQAMGEYRKFVAENISKKK